MLASRGFPCHIGSMSWSEEKRLERREALRVARHLQAMESNPLTAEQIAVFEMFEREGWSDAECREHLRIRAVERSGAATGE